MADKEVELDESVWDLPEEDRVRITVQEYDVETRKFRTVRPFRFCGGQGRILDDKTFMSE
jgi:hypothetical protein